MKTSLNIDDQIFLAAKKEALETGKSLSEIISYWARLGIEAKKSAAESRKKSFKAAELGAPLVDLDTRRDWMDILDDRS